MIQRVVEAPPPFPGEVVLLRDETRRAIVEAHGTYSQISGIDELVITKLRVVGRRRFGSDHRYVAHLSPCLRDECRDGRLAQCEKPQGHITVMNAWLKHIRTHCHGWHEASLGRFVTEVLATYDAPFRQPRTVGIPASKYRTVDYAPLTEQWSAA